MIWSKNSDKALLKASEPQKPSDSQPSNPENLVDSRKLSNGVKNTFDEVNRSPQKESIFEEYVEGYGPESTETNLRYAAYTNRIRTILSSTHRYVAYTSDIGESFRPVAHRNLVRSAYGISWLYILGDVSYEGYKSYLHNERIKNPTKEFSERQQKISGLEAKPQQPAAPGIVHPLEDYKTVMMQRAIFQSIASMGLPALTIHSIVKYSGRAMKDMKNKAIRTWAPIGLGLAIVPFLPSIYDHSVENVVEWAFHKGFEAYGGQSYVGDLPITGREKELCMRPTCNKN